MTKRQTLTRRDFTVQSALALLGGATITLAGCGDSSSPSPTTPSPPSPQPPQGDVMGTVSENHGHIAEIEAAEITAGGDLSLDIRGDADHPHTVDLTAAEVSQIGDGQRVSKMSSTNVAHAHTVTFN